MNRKPLVLTRHAEDAVDERELDRSRIERAVHDPHWTVADPNREGIERRYRAIPELGGRVLRVPCYETDREIRKLTAFLDRNARRPR